MVGVTQGEPVPIAVPPEEAVNHCMVLPAALVAARLTVVVPQPVAAVDPVIVGAGVTVTVTGLE